MDETTKNLIDAAAAGMALAIRISPSIISGLSKEHRKEALEIAQDLEAVHARADALRVLIQGKGGTT